MQATREYVGAEPATSAEGLIGTGFRSNLLVYPSISDSGRVRVSFDANYRQDLFGDLYLSFSFYDEYDSKPPPGGNNNEFGTTLAVGWDEEPSSLLLSDLDELGHGEADDLSGDQVRRARVVEDHAELCSPCMV
jgi:Protein of unknown function, DUF481